MIPSNKRVRCGCYAVNVSMAVAANLSPLLFLTFRELYGISYSLLGLLVAVNFLTQLGIDLIFSFFSHKFNIPLTVKLTPAICIVGMALFAAAPLLFPQSPYIGLVLGTLIFSAAGGLAEVLISPTVAALPSKDPDADMSRLHSVYAWGLVFFIIFGTLFLKLFGRENWQWLTLVLTLVPLSALLFFWRAEIPSMQTPERVSGALAMLCDRGIWLCIAAIFLSGAAECSMSQWSSSYLEAAMGIPKAWGDILGVAMFGVSLGLGRSLYAKYGKRIERTLLLGAIGAAACYLCAAISPIPLLGLVACALTGFCTSMMWPGSLIIASERFPTGGVFIYAVMAAGGDLGASLGSQLLGLVTDLAAASPTVGELAVRLSLAPEQLGMKLGMLVGMLFPLLGIAVYARLKKTKKIN